MTSHWPKPVQVGGRMIGSGLPVFIIAEIGINHEGSIDLCGKMIEAAAEAGADAVKLQTVNADASYVTGTESHAIFSRAGLSRAQTAAMFDLARSRGIEVFTTCGDMATLEWVTRLNPCAHKISSGLLTHTPLIHAAAKTGLPLLMSTGMATTENIDAAVTVARAGGAESRIGLFQCTSIYPCPSEYLNIATITWLQSRYALPIGFSDHSRGIEAAPLAVAAGACVIEKHYSFDPQRAGFDHHLSLDASGFAAMVRNIRSAETMIGRPEKRPVGQEIEAAAKYQRCLVASRTVAAGELFDAGSLTVKRPLPGRRGLAPRYYDQVLGRTARRELKQDDPVGPDDIEGGLSAAHM
jgi:sialic acid synthase SpsE